ncbi:hypothetical protein ACIP4W_39940, partial [Streptomyces sp. NPDC088846]|uniref:hypothetical protein n=1 Tax=Streptomyces sp. NPDC088846 TaxID=3365908 RepID=UPI003802B63F
ILVVNPSTRSFLHARRRGHPSNHPSGWNRLSVKNVEATEEVKTKDLSATGEVKTKDLSATGKFLVGSTNYCKMQDGDAWFSGQITAKDAATNRLLVGSENFGEMKKDDLWIGGKLTGADNVAKYDE